MMASSTYETELAALQEAIQQKVATMFSDPSNTVKRTLMEKTVTKLCVFFGKQKGNYCSGISASCLINMCLFFPLGLMLLCITLWWWYFHYFFIVPKFFISANDVLLSHMITFLNDKHDRHLRLSFFTSIVGVAAYIGCHCADILKPLLLQVCWCGFLVAVYLDIASLPRCT